MEDNSKILELQQKIDELEAKLRRGKLEFRRYVKSKKFTPEDWYRFWRTALKEQATVTTSIFFLFTGANIGYLVNSHINQNVVDGQTRVEYVPFSLNDQIALNFFVLSACCYGLLALSRYFDYRLKTRKFRNGASLNVVIKETKIIFHTSMVLLLGQILFFAVGFFFELRELHRLFY
jgi:hypothetical protein